MKKKGIFLLPAVIIMLLFVPSCSQDAGENGLALVSLSPVEDSSRSLSRVSQKLNAFSFYWTYTARKLDNSIFRTGETALETPVWTDKGLRPTGNFSYGRWEFSLFAYTDEERTRLAYTGTVEAVIRSAIENVDVLVEAQSSSMGAIRISPDISISASEAESPDTRNMVVKVSYSEVGSSYTETRYVEDWKNPVITDIPSGIYEVTLSFQNRRDEDAIGALIVYAEDTVYVSVYDYLTTEISGDIAKMTGSIKFEPVMKWIVSFVTEERGTMIATQFVRDGMKIEKPVNPTREGYSFCGWYESGSTSLFDFSQAITHDVTLIANWKKIYSVGETGPAGGVVFFVAESEQLSECIVEGVVTKTLRWRYLECAPSDAGSYVWGGKGVAYNTDDGIGDGWGNTERLCSYDSSQDNLDAARACLDYGHINNGVDYCDWFLPSVEELKLIYENVFLKEKGDIPVDRAYWSSTTDGVDNAWEMEFNWKNPEPDSYRRDRHSYVRPIRAFL